MWDVLWYLMLLIYLISFINNMLDKENGGERGIRTLEGVLALTPLAGERFRPLSHLSGPPEGRHIVLSVVGEVKRISR